MILVTGATGHLGNVLVRRLNAMGECVRAMVLPNEGLEPLVGLDVECVIGNVLDPDSCRRAMRGVDTVYHLAGIISIMSGRDELMRRVNVDGAANVAQAALDVGVERLVHVASVHAFERIAEGAIDESVPLVPAGDFAAYDATKAEGARAVLQAVERGLDAVIVCPTGVIGPYDYRRSELGKTLLGYARKKLKLSVDGAYDLVDVRDVAHGMVEAAERGRQGEMYILSGNHVRIPKLCDMVERITGHHAAHWVVPFKLAQGTAWLAEGWYRLLKTTPQFTRYSLEVLRSNSNISGAKARSEIGYSARPLSQTISDTVRWLMAPQTAVNPL